MPFHARVRNSRLTSSRCDIQHSKAVWCVQGEALLPGQSCADSEEEQIAQQTIQETPPEL